MSASGTVRKVSGEPATEPCGPPRRHFSAHFDLRIRPNPRSERCSHPFSDSSRRGVLGNLASGDFDSRKPPLLLPSAAGLDSLDGGVRGAASGVGVTSTWLSTGERMLSNTETNAALGKNATVRSSSD